eukprot:365658-Chlamydomonas_euryale.AAC.17
MAPCTHACTLQHLPLCFSRLGTSNMPGDPLAWLRQPQSSTTPMTGSAHATAIRGRTSAPPLLLILTSPFYVMAPCTYACIRA